MKQLGEGKKKTETRELCAGKVKEEEDKTFPINLVWAPPTRKTRRLKLFFICPMMASRACMVLTVQTCIWKRGQ